MTGLSAAAAGLSLLFYAPDPNPDLCTKIANFALLTAIKGRHTISSVICWLWIYTKSFLCSDNFRKKSETKIVIVVWGYLDIFWIIILNLWMHSNVGTSKIVGILVFKISSTLLKK